jgi:hypothetical protein
MRGALAALLLSGLPALAEADTPEFGVCIDIAAARYERELDWHRASPFAESFGIGDGFHLRHCGDVGVWQCTRARAVGPCLSDLADRQSALRQSVIDSLPPPEEVQGLRGVWSDRLYPRLHALALGRSAGPDCAGLPEAAALRCAARAAALRVSIAVRAWYLARYLGAAPDAITAGWAVSPPPTRPRARDDNR